jgi:uncharacterized protein (UPF0335 family)
VMVERLTVIQAASRLDAAEDEVERLEEELRRARRSVRSAYAEMHNALYERLSEPLP